MSAQHTEIWKAVPLGGTSTVLSSRRIVGDTRIPAYGYDESQGYCIAHPFIEDDGRGVRLDFVCFSHERARLIAAAPDLLAALRQYVACDTIKNDGLARMASAAIAKATGSAS